MNAADREFAHALRWITEIMAGASARYQAVGGLAARAYGSRRPLVDLDFYMPAQDLARVLKELGPHRVWGPEPFRDDCWDLTFTRVEWQGVRIELADAEGARYYSRAQGRWVDQRIDFGRSTRRTVLGVEVPVMPKDRLIAYKRDLDRPVDRRDLEEID
jgi:hypothetical protein